VEEHEAQSMGPDAGASVIAPQSRQMVSSGRFVP
jgi:hypothetical protein